MLDPKLLMLDEPTTGLAPVIADEVIKQILDINHSGTAILWVVEENPASVLEHCPRDREAYRHNFVCRHASLLYYLRHHQKGSNHLLASPNSPTALMQSLI
jgi:ABC-type dipeptide/oligopeptide/nickel transport system ATPase subunit